MLKNKRQINTQDFESIILKLAAPEKIKEWSQGEVTKPETINYRTQRSEKNGLFDERIFGPEKDFECYCGKYKGIRYKGIVCEKCGVEITRSIVRRDRMGHIELASPVSHIWFLRNIPSRMALILGVMASALEKVIYFASYIIVSVNEEERVKLLKELDTEYKSTLKKLKDSKSKDKLKELYLVAKKEIAGIKERDIIDDATYNKYSIKYSSLFEATIGAEAVYEIFKTIDLHKLEAEVSAKIETSSAIERKKQRKRLSLVRSMIKSETRPEWMFLTNIPITPAAIRPMVSLDGGRHATSDVNDLYRRVINRNNRLKKLMAIHAPNVILRNEKRILQEAVDALLDNSMRHGNASFSSANRAQRRPLKSLADNLKGKQGLFRQNLLGKRVDYSGRSVIVIGPDLKLNQCGLPKHMALELFRPFIISKLIKNEVAYNIRGAGRLIDEATPEVWAILEEVIENKYVLLNRAPTLHRLGIQAFQPVLIEGNAIQVHPLVVTAFNADFDGDQMAVHVPLSDEAQMEAREIMAANKNLLGPGNGTPIVSVAHQDIVLGCYWMTKVISGLKGEGKIFPNPNSAIMAYDFDAIDIRASIKVMGTEHEKYSKFKDKIFETSVGRLLFNSVLPNDYLFINQEVKKGDMKDIVDELITRYDNAKVTVALDKIKNFGFKYSTMSGITFGIDDIIVPDQKPELVKKAKEESDKIHEQYEDGLLSEDERYRKNISVWHSLRNDMEELVSENLTKDGSMYDMWHSGARGSLSQITNMAGLKGLIAGSSGKTIEFPILSSNKEGLTPIEYFTTTHGSRKGLGDTALNTSRSGYLTRKLFDVAQDVVIREDNCKTKNGILIRKQNLGGIEVDLSKNIQGRFLAEEIKDEKGKTVFKKGHYITKEDASHLEDIGIERAYARSPISCESQSGICKTCYGRDLGTNDVVGLGEAIGTVAAQAIGEPATQLTMRTFHAGGTATVGGDIVSGLPRVEEVFEKRPPKNPAIISEISGLVTGIKTEDGEKVVIILPDATNEKPKTKKKIKKGKEKETGTESVAYIVNPMRMLLVQKGDSIKKGQRITDGSADLTEMYKYAGAEDTQEYIINEISKVYEMQGATVSRKHIEVIIRQMFSRLKVLDGGDTKLSKGDIVELSVLKEENDEVKASGGDIAKATTMIKGITDVALSRKSFLSSASFQNTSRVLINNAIRGTEDKLVGLKENIIIGRLIPAGTGFEGGPKQQMIASMQTGDQDAE